MLIRRAIACLTLLFTAACGTPPAVRMADTDPASWKRPVELLLPNDDTLALRDLTLILRSDARFDDDTLTLRLELVAPDTVRRYAERVLFRLPHRRTAAAVREEKLLPYRLAVRLADSGLYRLRIAPARPVRGIEAAGIRITPHTPNTETPASPTWEKTNSADSPKI